MNDPLMIPAVLAPLGWPRWAASWRALGILLLGIAIVSGGAPPAVAQRPPAAERPEAPPPPREAAPRTPQDRPAAGAAREQGAAPARPGGRAASGPPAGRGTARQEDPFKPRAETLQTRDGVELMCGYFPSDKGKSAVPVILVHEWEGQGSPYIPLARELQKIGCAVALPDLRGHGGSRRYVDARGASQEFDVKRMGRRDVEAMVKADLEAVKKFLQEENDAEKVNLNALTLIGIREGAVLAMNYAMVDWSWPDVGSRKQSKDVRCVVLVSPEKMVKGMNLEPTLRHAGVNRLATLLIAGGDSREDAEAQRIHRMLERVHRAARGPLVGPVELVSPPTALSGAQLVNQVPAVPEAIGGFIQQNVVERAEHFPWVDRSRR